MEMTLGKRPWYRPIGHSIGHSYGPKGDPGWMIESVFQRFFMVSCGVSC